MSTDQQPAAYVSTITTFDADGSVDLEAQRAHFRRLADNGIGVYLGSSGTAEADTLSFKETQQIFEVAVDELKGRVPVRSMGIEPHSAAEFIEFVRMAETTGVDAVQVSPLLGGHGFRAGPAELEAYFCDILDVMQGPAVLASHMVVGYSVPVELIASLCAKFDNIIGVNATHLDDFTYVSRLRGAISDEVEIIVGSPFHALEALALGANGWVTSMDANLAPEFSRELVDALVADRWADIRPAFKRVNDLFLVLMGFGGVTATKAALNLLGLPGGYPRPPRHTLPPERIDVLASALQRFGFLRGDDS